MIRVLSWTPHSSNALRLAPLGLSALLACSPPPPQGPREPPWNDVPQVQVATPGVVIVAEDRAFRLESGEAMRTPFTGGCVLEPTSANFADGEAGGGRRVLVKHPAASQVLYGILSFCQVNASVTGPASRSYSIDIPESFVAATDAGRVSVVFEYTGYERSNGRGGVADAPSWILWLSRQRFR